MRQCAGRRLWPGQMTEKEGCVGTEVVLWVQRTELRSEVGEVNAFSVRKRKPGWRGVVWTWDPGQPQRKTDSKYKLPFLGLGLEKEWSAWNVMEHGSLVLFPVSNFRATGLLKDRPRAPSSHFPESQGVLKEWPSNRQQPWGFPFQAPFCNIPCGNLHPLTEQAPTFIPSASHVSGSHVAQRHCWASPLLPHLRLFARGLSQVGGPPLPTQQHGAERQHLCQPLQQLLQPLTACSWYKHPPSSSPGRDNLRLDALHWTQSSLGTQALVIHSGDSAHLPLILSLPCPASLCLHWNFLRFPPQECINSAHLMFDAVFLGEPDLRHLTANLPVLLLLALFLKDFLRFFLRWTILKIIIEFVTILFLFYVLVCWPQVMWELSTLTRDWTCTPCIGKWCCNHWTPREVPADSTQQPEWPSTTSGRADHCPAQNLPKATHYV